MQGACFLLPSRLKTVGQSIETISIGVSTIIAENHVGTLNGAFQAYLVQNTAWRSVTLRMFVKIRRLSPRWILNSVAKFVCRQFAKLGFEVFILCADVCFSQIQNVLASVFVDSTCCVLVLSSMSYDRKMNSVFTCNLLTL